MTMERLQAHYGFTRMPFGRNLAPGMLHRHEAHNQAVARITWCVQHNGLGVVTGEVGAGKTVAVRAALAGLDPTRHTIIYLPNPAVGVRGLYTHIVASLGGTPSFYLATLVAQTSDLIAGEAAERGRSPVLVIDEAHLLDHDQLEAIRMLTNHDMDSDCPFATLLIGQPTLRRRINLGVLAALDQRITLRYAMPGMIDTETASYLRHHIGLAPLTELGPGVSGFAGRVWLRVRTFRLRDWTRHAAGAGFPGGGEGRFAGADRRPVGAVPAAWS